MTQDDRKNQTNSPGLYEQFAQIVNPEVQKMMSNSVSGGTYDELFQKASNSILKRLGLLSPTSGLTTPENQIDPYRILAANGSKNTSVFDDVEAHVQQTNSFNPYNETQQPNDPEDREEHKRTQHLAILEANQMFDALLQENDFQLDPLTNNERAAYTSHMLGKPQDQRATLAKKLVNRDLKALEDLNPINAFLAGFDPEAQMEAPGSVEADQGIDISPRPTDQGIDISPRPTDEEDGRSLLQRGLDLIFSPAAAAELTPELRAQLDAVRTRLPPVRPEYPASVRNDENFDLDRKTYKAYPSAFTQTALNEDDTPKGLRFEPHIDNVNIFTLGGGVTNLKNVKWTGEDKYGFEKDKFYNKKQIQNKIEANSGSKAKILKGLDTSKAVETTSGLSREQFGDNKSFAYAVYKGYEDRLTDKLETYGLDTSKLNENVLGALTDYFWNMEKSAESKNSSGVRIAKAYIDGDEDWYKKAWEGTSAMLDNIIAGGKPMLGIAKRRAIHYNMMGPPEGKGITKITLDGYNLNYIAEDGSTLYTRTDKNKNKITSKQTTLDVVAKAIQAARVDNDSVDSESSNTFVGDMRAAIDISPRSKN